MLKYYGFSKSGHSHRGELFLNLIDQPYERIDVALGQGEHKSEEFRRMNPLGQVPAIDDEGFLLGDSTAILVYLAEKYADAVWYPKDAESRAKIQRWLSIASREIAAGPASARLVNVFGAKLDHEDLIKKSNALLEVIDAELDGKDWLIGSDAPTIADVAAYSYIAHAPEGDVSLEPYANVTAWLKRVEALKGFVPMPATAVGLVKEA